MGSYQRILSSSHCRLPWAKETPHRPQPTPVRPAAVVKTPPGQVGGDQQPVAGKLRISAEAMEARMRRIFSPNVRGEYKVSTDIVAQWRDKRKGRKSLQQVFQACGLDVDMGFENSFELCLMVPQVKWLYVS